MTGRLPEISPWCKFDRNAWADPEGKGHSGWEELPYWLKGYGDLGYVLKDEAIIKEARRWIEAVAGQPGARRLVRPPRAAHLARRQARPVAAHAHAQRAAVVSTNSPATRGCCRS